MDLYSQTSAEMAELLTRRYSSSFSAASRLFSADIQKHIYNIYGFVRIADEIVDTYSGADKLEVLNQLEAECYAALARCYSANPIVQAFVDTAHQFDIDKSLIAPFIDSMRMDIEPQAYDHKLYETYIFGSAEVVGLMCLRVFCANDQSSYYKLAPGAQKLGAAYQKVNFLRDLAADHTGLARWYFPEGSFEAFDDAAKQVIVADIKQDFATAMPYVEALPIAARKAIAASFTYYSGLLDKLEATPAETIKTTRIRLPAYKKLQLLAVQKIRRAV